MEKKRRPGRKEGAERRRIARAYLREFYRTEEFQSLPRKYRLAILELCPEKDSHPWEPVRLWEPRQEQENLHTDYMIRA